MSPFLTCKIVQFSTIDPHRALKMKKGAITAYRIGRNKIRTHNKHLTLFVTAPNDQTLLIISAPHFASVPIVTALCTCLPR